MTAGLSLWLLAFAPPPGQGGQGGSMPMWAQLFPLLLMLVVFFLIVILPQQRKAKQHQQLLGSLKAGDKVVTSSGIVGTVVNVGDRHVTLRSEDAKLEILKSAVSEITERKA